MKKQYFNRELSWIRFNRRVLEESVNPDNPLLEQGKFLSICESNLDEFFMVRVGSLERNLTAGSKERDIAGMTPNEQLTRIHVAVRKQVARQYEIYNQVYLPQLRSAGIYLHKIKELTREQEKWADDYFDREVAPLLTPYAIDPRRPFPLLAPRCLHLAVLLSPCSPGQPHRFALLPIPQNLDRVVMLPEGEGRARGVFLEDLVISNAQKVFGTRPVICQPFRITRNQDFYYNDSNAQSLIIEMRKNLKRRKFGRIVRLEIPNNFDSRLLLQLKKYLGMSARTIFHIPGPINLNFFMKQISDLEGFDDLRFPKYQPRIDECFTSKNDIFDVIREKTSLFLHHPYDSFEPVLRLLDAASEDPDVLAIKQTLYRVSGKSPVVAALERAARNGKQVTVLIEVRARFDEENNINWCTRLEKAGCHVIYGIPNYKCHSKITLIIRREGGTLARYVHLGTGNYNDVTARLYTDMGLITSDPIIGMDASNFFNNVTGFAETRPMTKLVASPDDIRDRLIDLMHEEIKAAEDEEPCGIIMKVNGLTDKKMINQIYKTADRGVPITLIVRSACCLDVKGHPNIQVRSIVGRFLEHARVYCFTHQGNPVVYLSSADLMTRNLDKRVELMFPIEDALISARIQQELRFEIEDNLKAWILKKNGSYYRAERKPPYMNVQEQNIHLADPLYQGNQEGDIQ